MSVTLALRVLTQTQAAYACRIPLLNSSPLWPVPVGTTASPYVQVHPHMLTSVQSIGASQSKQYCDSAHRSSIQWNHLGKSVSSAGTGDRAVFPFLGMTCPPNSFWITDSAIASASSSAVKARIVVGRGPRNGHDVMESGCMPRGSNVAVTLCVVY